MIPNTSLVSPVESEMPFCGLIFFLFPPPFLWFKSGSRHVHTAHLLVFKKVLLKTTFLLTKCIICPKTRLWLSRLFYSAFQLKVNRMLCLIFPIFLHLQSCHTVSSLIAWGKFRWSHINVVTPRKKIHFSSLSLAQNPKRERVKIKKHTCMC